MLYTRTRDVIIYVYTSMVATQINGSRQQRVHLSLGTASVVLPRATPPSVWWLAAPWWWWRWWFAAVVHVHGTVDVPRSTCNKHSIPVHCPSVSSDGHQLYTDACRCPASNGASRRLLCLYKWRQGRRQCAWSNPDHDRRRRRRYVVSRRWPADRKSTTRADHRLHASYDYALLIIGRPTAAKFRPPYDRCPAVTNHWQAFRLHLLPAKPYARTPSKY